MTDPQLGVFMLILFVGLIMLGYPIAFTLMAMGVGFAWLAFDGNDTHRVTLGKKPDDVLHTSGQQAFALLQGGPCAIVNNQSSDGLQASGDPALS